jgi:hypothetical protein
LGGGGGGIKGLHVSLAKKVTQFIL